MTLVSTLARGAAAAGPGDVHVSLLGVLAVQVGARLLGPRDFGGGKPKQLLELLVLARGRPMTKDRLAEELWGEERTKKVGTLEAYVSVLRRHLDVDQLVETVPGGYRFATERIELDLDRFDALVARAAKAGPRASAALLEDALSIVRGELIEDEPYACWAETARRIYGERVVQARLDAASAALACRDFDAALAHAERAVEGDPLSEPAYRVLMLATYALGRQDAALRHYERCHRVLETELGVEPMQETWNLYCRIQDHHPGAELLPPPAWDGLPPAIDLRAPAVPFVGRGEELERLRGELERAMAGECTVAVVGGDPGIGKTRLVREVLDSLVGVRVGKARCLSLERDLPFMPLAMALRAALPPDAPDPLATVLERLAVEAGDAGRIRAMEALAELIAVNGPTVLFLDDAQYADPSTVVALAFLRRRLADAPLALVAAVDSGHPSDTPISLLEPEVRLSLGPIDRSTVERLGQPGLFERTGGHALLVAECLEAARDGSAEELPLRLGPWVIEQAQVAGPLAHQLLTTAAVFDGPFPPEPLIRVVSGDAAEVVEELDRLCERGLLRVAGEGYDFRYPLLREILRGSISPAKRRIVRDVLVEATLELACA